MSVLGGSAPAEREHGPGAPLVRMTGVRKRFGYREVLRGVDLEVPRGACFVLAGPNGAGKSTILRILSTQWGFTQGRVEVCGFDLERQPVAARARLGIVFHEPFLRRELTLEENLRFAAELRGQRWAGCVGRIQPLLERFGLTARRRDLVRTFSQGMLKRASIIRSLIAEPELWVLDEPFSGLDPRGQELLEEVIKEFTAAGGTTLLVTHQAAHARRLASASARIEDGRIARRGQGAQAFGEEAAEPQEDAEPPEEAA